MCMIWKTKCSLKVRLLLNFFHVSENVYNIPYSNQETLASIVNALLIELSGVPQPTGSQFESQLRHNFAQMEKLVLT